MTRQEGTIPAEQLVQLVKLYEEMGRLLIAMGGSGQRSATGHFKRRALTKEQSRALMMEQFSNERRQKV